MKKISLLLLAFTFSFSYNVFAQQNWYDMMKDHSANVKDVQNAFYKWYAANKPDDTASNAVGEEKEEDGNFLLFKRWEWLMVPRSYPTGVQPDPAVLEKQYQDFLTNSAKHSVHKLMGSSATWSYAGTAAVPTGGDAGRVNHLRIDPTNPSILYACCPSGGLWKSTNGGTSWATNTDHLLGIGTSDIAIDPTNNQVLYLATGDGDGILGGYTTPSTIGVLKSTDGGLTWNQTGLHYTLQASGPSYYTVNELAINPSNPNILLAAASFGLYYTSDGGITWISVTGGSFKSVAFEPGNPKVAYATTANGGYYRSSDGGVNFSSVTLPSSSGSGRMQVGVTPAGPNYVYVFADNASNNAFFGIWQSKDTGKTFTLMSTTPNVLGFNKGTGSDATQGQGWYTLSMDISPVSATTLIVGGVNVWTSTNGGSSWTKLSSWTNNPYVHADIHSLTYLPGSGSTFYAACDGGVFKTTNTGSSWTDLSNGLEIAEQYGIGLSASSSTEWITGWQDNGTNLANAGAWTEVMGGDGMTAFIDNTSNSYMYGEQYDGTFNMSSNGGATWNQITNGLTETGGWNTPWCQDPKSSSTLFAGLSNVWKSTNRGTSWSKISTFGSGTSTLAAIAVAPSNDQYIYTAYTGSMYGTTNGGGTWTNITGTLPGNISNITVDPTNPLHVFATISGFSTGIKVYESTNAGTTWVNISNGLPNLPANCLAYQGNGINAMYVGTDMGVYYRDTTTTAGTWVNYSTDLPNVIVSDLKIYAPGNILRAATYGRGTWQIALYQAAISAPVAYFTAFPTKLCVGNTVQFTDTSTNEPTSWNWTFAGGTPATSTSQNPVVTYSTAGTYQVKMVTSNGIGTDSITVINYITVNPNPTTPTIVQHNDTLDCTPSTYAFYQWYKTATPIAGATTAQCVITATGIYKVIVSDSNGCTNQGSLLVKVLGINEIALNDYINVYPNPTSGNLQVVFNVPTEDDYTVSLTDILGQTIYTTKLHIVGEYTQNLNLSGYGKGIYLLSVTGKDSKGVKKIMLY